MNRKEGARILEVDSPGLLEMVRMIRETVFVIEQEVPLDREYDEFEDASRYLLAFIGDDPVGCIRFRPYGPGNSKIERLAVLKEHRGKGLGRMLMERAESEAKSDQASIFILNSQMIATGFYRSLGYSEVGDVFLDAGIEHIEMRKGIDRDDRF